MKSITVLSALLACSLQQLENNRNNTLLDSSSSSIFKQPTVVDIEIEEDFQTYLKKKKQNDDDSFEKEDDYFNCLTKKCLVMDKRFKKLQIAIGLMERQMKQFFVDPNIPAAYLLGPTGSGKSTVINYLLGALIKVEEDNGFQIRLKVDSQNSGHYAEIGSGGSCTKIPAAYHHKKQDINFIDTAGFMDTNGPEIQIVNAHAISQMFQRGKKVKLIILISIDTLTSARGNDLPKIIKVLNQMFQQDFQLIRHATALVINKVPIKQKGFFQTTVKIFKRQFMGHKDEDNEGIRKDIQKKISEIIRTNKNLSQGQIQFLKGLLNQKQLLFIPNANFLNKKIIQQIQQDIKNIPSIILRRDAQISLSSQPQNLLYQFKIQLTEQLKKKVKNIKQAITVHVQNAITTKQKDIIIKQVEKILKAKNFLQDLKEDLQENFSITEKISRKHNRLFMNKQQGLQLVGLLKRFKLCEDVTHKSSEYVSTSQLNQYSSMLYQLYETSSQGIQLLNKQLQMMLKAQQYGKLHTKMIQQERIRRDNQEIERQKKRKQEELRNQKIINDLQDQNKVYIDAISNLKGRIDTLQNKNCTIM